MNHSHISIYEIEDSSSSDDEIPPAVFGKRKKALETAVLAAKRVPRSAGFPSPAEKSNLSVPLAGGDAVVSSKKRKKSEKIQYAVSHLKDDGTTETWPSVAAAVSPVGKSRTYVQNRIHDPQNPEEDLREVTAYSISSSKTEEDLGELMANDSSTEEEDAQEAWDVGDDSSSGANNKEVVVGVAANESNHGAATVRTANGAATPGDEDLSPIPLEPFHSQPAGNQPAKTNPAETNPPKNDFSRRKRGKTTFAWTVPQQYDKFARAREEQAAKAFGQFSDTSFHPSQESGFPTVQSVLLVYNNMRNQPTKGGSPGNLSCETPERPKITVYARSKEQVLNVIGTYAKSMMEETRNNYRVEEVFATCADQRLETAVKERIQRIKQERLCRSNEEEEEEVIEEF